MNGTQKLAKNTVILFISQFIGYVLGFFYIMYSARYLGAENFGILSSAIALTGIFGVFMDLGLSTFTTREVSKDKKLAGKFLGNTILIRSILSSFIFLIIVIFVNILPYPPIVKNIIYIIALSTVFAVAADIFNSIFQSYEKMEFRAIGQILNNFFLLAGALIAITFKFDITGFAIVYLIANLLFLIYSAAACIRKFILPKIEIDLYFWKWALLESLPISFAILFSIIVFRIDTVILSLIKGNMAVGYYNASYKLIEALMVVPIVFSTAIYPVFSKLHVYSKDSLSFSYNKSLKYLIILGLPIAAGSVALSDQIILLIYGAGFIQSSTALKILIWAIPIIYLTYLFRILLISVNKQKLLLIILSICMIFNITTNVIFIPYFSYLGSSLATVLTEFLSLVLSVYFISKNICKIEVKTIAIKPVIASFFVFLVANYFKNNLLIAILLSTLIYFGILFAMKTFSESDLIIFKRIFNRE
ncbi:MULTISPECIES: flippase [Methanobacterium]|uniref:Flippase n=1 Tax=Methanobacterium veterum TaxID=408577 RepID=A0A9E5DN64_9EURY|nr:MULTISPECIES: flippase [Methanobacterium]MCZ3367480.1 flippase [Methanobacterium veterum]MCZ3373372.1 flippase [Methanobacterium veterum]